MPTEQAGRRTVARASMYTMLGFTSVSHFLTREMGPQLIPFICNAYGFDDQQRGLLLGAYFPGYVCGQLPAALLADRIGGKRVISMSMWCTVTMMLCTGPTAASIPAAFAISTILGFAGGPLYPVHGILKRDWMPQTLGAERAMVLRCTNWGMQIGRFLTSILTPLIASTWGWRAVPLVYAAFTAATTLPWEAWASDTPSSWNGWPRMGAAERALLTESPAGGSTATAESKLEARPFPWRLLASKPAIAPILMHTADNMGTYTFSYWSPTYFQQQFKISPTATGAYLASTHLFSIAGGFVAPLLEVAFLNAGADPLKVRRFVGAAGLTMQAACLSAFVFAKGPLFGAACNAMYNFFKCFTNDGGYQTNYIEVGGLDTGVLYATGQTIANIPGMFVTVGGAALVAATGSWLPLFLGVAGLQVLAAAFFGSVAMISPTQLTKDG